MAARRAFITGIAGQDGSYLAEWLLELGYEVHGLVRPPLRRPLPNLKAVRPQLHLWPGDVADSPRLARLLRLVKPDEIYNLAGVSFIADTWSDPVGCWRTNAAAVVGLLDAARRECPAARVFQAGTSEIFGQPDAAPQNEGAARRPRSPYGLAKAAAHEAVAFHRRAHGLFAVGGILFNHESPRRPAQYVTRKISQAVARIAAGRQREVKLGSLDAVRDWGFAGDAVRAMHLALQAKAPADYVVGTGRLRSVESLAAVAFAAAGLDWRDHVTVDPALCRPPEAVPLVADAAAIRADLGWEPSVSFEELIADMVRHDLKREGVRAARRLAAA